MVILRWLADARTVLGTTVGRRQLCLDSSLFLTNTISDIDRSTLSNYSIKPKNDNATLNVSHNS